MNGDGSSMNPWQITTIEEHQLVGNGYDAGTDKTYAASDHYVWANDIDASDTETWNAGDGFVPLPPFTGSLNGQGHKLSNLHIKRTNVGLFSELGANGIIENAHLRNIVYEQTSSINARVGGLVSAASGNNLKTIKNCSVTGTIKYIADINNACGGIVGYLRYSFDVQKCWTDITLERIGGTSTNFHGAGGIIGYVQSATNTPSLEDCYSKGSHINPHANVTAGGIIGRIDMPGVDHLPAMRVYSTMDMTGFETVDRHGGLVGRKTNTGTASMADSFWDTEAGNISISVYGTGKTTAQMQAIATFNDTDTVGLDTAWNIVPEASYVDEVWFMPTGDYPKLGWEYVAASDLPIRGVVEMKATATPVEGALVTAINSVTDEVIGTDTTDALGKFAIYKPAEMEVTTVHVIVEYESGGTKYNAKSQHTIDASAMTEAPST